MSAAWFKTLTLWDIASSVATEGRFFGGEFDGEAGMLLKGEERAGAIAADDAGGETGGANEGATAGCFVEAEGGDAAGVSIFADVDGAGVGVAAAGS